MGRSKLYHLALKYPGLFRKNGKSTLVDLDVFDTILSALPAARLGTRAA